MPLALANMKTVLTISRISGSDDLRLHLEKLGFTAGSVVTVVASMSGNLIVKVKDSRIALSREMAMRVFV